MQVFRAYQEACQNNDTPFTSDSRRALPTRAMAGDSGEKASAIPPPPKEEVITVWKYSDLKFSLVLHYDHPSDMPALFTKVARDGGSGTFEEASNTAFVEPPDFDAFGRVAEMVRKCARKMAMLRTTATRQLEDRVMDADWVDQAHVQLVPCPA